jgi:hypothetical protein
MVRMTLNIDDALLKELRQQAAESPASTENRCALHLQPPIRGTVPTRSQLQPLAGGRTLYQGQVVHTSLGSNLPGLGMCGQC